MLAADNLTALLHEAINCQQAGERARAESMYRQILSTHSGQDGTHDLPAAARNQLLADACNNFAILLLEQGRIDESEQSYRQALSFNPHFADAHCNLAYLHYETGRIDAAVGHFRQALAIAPSHFDSLTGLAHATAETGDYKAAADALQKALAIQPADAALWNDLGNAMLVLENAQAADAAYLNALTLQPESSLAHYNYANFLLQQHRVDQAAHHYRSVLSIEPEHIEARINLASCAKLLGNLHAAIATYREIVARSPDSAQNQLNLALALLSQGHFKEGWELHESRLNFPSEQARIYPYPRWSGESLAGKTIFIWGERGYGDEIQFVRFLPTLRELGARVIFECRPELHDLLQRANLCDLLVLPGSAPISGGIDYQLPLLSMPLMLGVDSFSKLPDKPYLNADPMLAEYWKAKLTNQLGKRVGLVWAGNPQHQNDASRSIPFFLFSRITQHLDIAFYSLQKNSGQGDYNGIAMANHTGEFKNFSDTAAFIENLDLVISVDTAVAHLAAAMGKATWVLVAGDYDWRWFSDRLDSPWYRSVRLFRQHKPGDWDLVLEEVNQTLKSMG